MWIIYENMYWYINDEIAFLENLENSKKQNAGYKAKKDAYTIFENNDIYSIDLDFILHFTEHNNILYRVFNKIITEKHNFKLFKEKVNNLNNNDVIFVQIPFFSLDIDTLKCVKYLHSKGIKLVYLVHDLEMLRYDLVETKKEKIKTFVKKLLGLPIYDELKLLSYGDVLILHNSCMIKECMDIGICNIDNIVSLDLFDYIIDDYHEPKCSTEEIMIAGNLCLTKAGYLKDLPSNCEFGLYGSNYDRAIKKENINYYGAFMPDELIQNLNGKYGLVWDGNSTVTCDGAMGNYLRFNSPHKTSLFLACSIPVIAWKETAIADFILNNKCGIVVDNLMDLKLECDKINAEMYAELKNNARRIGSKLRAGYMLSSAISKSKIILNKEYGIEI